MVPYKQVQKLFEDKWNDNDKRYNVSDKYSTFRQNIWVNIVTDCACMGVYTDTAIKQK